jgi:AcrR family transcriptional regulator
MGKKDILDRILKMFMRYGIRSITMDDIARELGVSKKTLYHDFEDKNDLIERVINFDMMQSRKFLEEVHRTELDAIEEVFKVNARIHEDRSRYSPTFFYDLKRYFPEFYRRWLEDKRQNMFGLIVGNLRKGKQEGVYRKEIQEEIIGKLYMARMEMLDSSEIIDGHQTLSAECMQEIFIYHMHGICNGDGLQTLAEFKEKSNNQQVKEL